jgi:hypothetical protein
MEGGISLSDFIIGVKNELIQASEKGGKDTPLLELTEVELEANFVLGVSAKGGMDFFVKVEGDTSATQTHRVKIKMKPLAHTTPQIYTTENQGISISSQNKAYPITNGIIQVSIPQKGTTFEERQGVIFAESDKKLRGVVFSTAKIPSELDE